MDTINLEEENVDEIVYEVVNAKAASYENQCKRTPIPRKRKSKKDSDSTASDGTLEKKS